LAGRIWAAVGKVLILSVLLYRAIFFLLAGTLDSTVAHPPDLQPLASILLLNHRVAIFLTLRARSWGPTLPNKKRVWSFGIVSFQRRVECLVYGASAIDWPGRVATTGTRSQVNGLARECGLEESKSWRGRLNGGSLGGWFLYDVFRVAHYDGSGRELVLKLCGHLGRILIWI
jgi:hypothetical protein